MTAPARGATANNEWWNGTSDLVWSNTGCLAVFGGAASGTAGTVNVSGPVTASTVTFNTPYAGNYTLGSSSGTLTITSGIVQSGSAAVAISVPLVISTSASLSGAAAA